MPVIKSAKKKLRQDKKRELENKKLKEQIKLIIKKTKKSPVEKNLKEAFKLVDKGVRKNIFHKNKGGRVKSALSKLIKKDTAKSAKKS